MAKKEDKKSKESAAVEAPKGPVQKAFAIEKHSNGKWVLQIYDVQDGKIVGCKSSEAEPKSLSVERFKIEFVKHYVLGKN